jgi:hypothetical protein
MHALHAAVIILSYFVLLFLVPCSHGVMNAAGMRMGAAVRGGGVLKQVPDPADTGRDAF